MKTRLNRRQLVMLLAVVAGGAYFRLWNVEHTFNVIHDFDEGAYAIGARAILDGSLPYRDFILIHPPLYNLVLSLGYRLLGYDFLIGRYLSVLFSVGCILAVYVLGKRLYHSTAGVVAAGFFACSGLPVYLGRRGVQDSLGLLLLLVGLVFAVQYVSEKTHRSALLAGLFFGFATATKYLFLPVVVGSVVAVLLCAAPGDVWMRARCLASPRFWARYASVSIAFYAFVLLARRLALAPLPIPLLEPLYPSLATAFVVVTVFLVPVPCAFLLMGYRPSPGWLAQELPSWIAGKGALLALLGAVSGFFIVVAPFLLRAPAEYLYQTGFLHQQRNIAEVPSLVGLVRVLPLSDISLFLTSIPVLCAIPVIVVLLHRRGFSRSSAFVAVTLIVALLLCQAFPPMPRYYICIYPLVFLGLAQLVGTEVHARRRTALFTYGVVCVLFLVSLVSTVDILLRYSPDASVRDGRMYTPDERAYVQVAASLRQMGAQKVYAVNPAFAAMANGTESSIRADSLAELFLMSRPALNVLQDLAAEGVDHIVLDPWLTYWGDSWEETRLFADAVRENARLVSTIRYGSTDHVEIYRLRAEPEPLFNGDFVLWDRNAGVDYPAGWQPVLVDGEGDLASLGQRYHEGRKCVALTVFEDGIAEDDDSGTHAGITQALPFPDGLLFFEVQCSDLTEVVGVGARGPAIHFLDAEGHSLVVAFSDTVSEERLYPCDSCDQMLVMEPCRPYEWEFYSLNLRYLWSKTGWPEPESIRILLVVSAAGEHAGYYEFLVSGVVGD